MGRRMMTREVTKTTVKVAKMEIQEGVPVAIALPDEVLLGNVRLERAQRVLDKKYGEPVTVLQVLPETQVYELEVEEFIKIARIKEEEPKEQDQE